MPSTRAIRDLIYRVRITPTPQTQSESGAILRRLHDFGPITFFKIHRTETGAGADQKDAQQVLATLVFAHDTEELKALHSNVTKQTLHVTANANIPDAAIDDPYNAQGRKTRKPALLPRTFKCRIEHVKSYEERKALNGSDILKQLQSDDKAGPFTVDRRSILGEILAKTDAPSGLIHGLLPRIDDCYRDQKYKHNSAKNFKSQKRQDWDSMAVNVREMLDDPDTVMKSIDMARDFNDDTTGSTKDNGLPRDAASDTEDAVGGEFAVLKDFSLMDMYRDAIQKDTSSDTSETPQAHSTKAGNSYRSP